MNLATYAAGIYRDCIKFYQNPENLSEFERWKREREEREKCERGKLAKPAGSCPAKDMTVSNRSR